MHTKRLAQMLLILSLLAAPATAQQVQVQEYVLDNGLKLLMVPRKGDPNIAAGWIAKVGSVNERPGITGMSHLFEHMMFKGTKAIGTKNIDEDLKVMARMDQVKSDLRVEEHELLRRHRLGEITDLKDPKVRSEKHQKLLQELSSLEKLQKELLITNEFDRIYTTAGASGMNAGTSQDFTVYFINVPANKLELWFWMESDRLVNPVFREFYAERDVVAEERRLRTDSTPTGKFEEEFEALFWSASPYSWPTVGWPSDLEGITREEALAYFDLNYAPNNITACLVGDFEPAQAKVLADRYFGRLKRNPLPPPPVRTREPEPLAERRMVAYAETNPQVEVRYLSVAEGHKDDAPLTVLSSLLSGRTGRLYKSLVLDQQIATSASAGQNSLKWQGYFSLNGTAKPGNKPEEVEQALYKEIEKLQNTPVEARELQKVKNQFTAGTFRRVQNNFNLMLQLLLADNTRGWKSFNEDPKDIDKVSAADIQRVTKDYFKPELRAVAVYYTKKGAATESDPALEGLNAQEQAMVKQMGMKIQAMSIDDAKKFLASLESQESAVPADQKKVFEAMKKLLLQKIEKGGGK